MVPKKLLEINSFQSYLLFLFIGMMVGNRVLPDLVGIFYLIAALSIIYFALDNKVVKVLTVFPFLIYSEMFVRAYVTWIPYLFMPYLFLIVFSILIANRGSFLKVHNRYFILMFIFLLVELINSFRTNFPDNTRALLINSTVIAMVALWGSSNVIAPDLANKILNSLKLAGIYLCGIILMRYLKGSIEFQAYSGSEGTNGLAPVQTSGYLGFTASIFFFSIMNGGKEKKNLVINILALVLSAVFMLLSFSRGGIYFLAIMMALYISFNYHNFKKYFLLLLLLPIGLTAYNFVVAETNGLIKERYNQEGTSGRADLIRAAYRLFLDHPLTGVGVGNFNEEIRTSKLYDESSGVHNEFARVAAEDGILGLIFYWGFFMALFINILYRRAVQREYAIYFFVFFCLIIVHNGLKISLQPFLLLLAIATPSFKKIKINEPGNLLQPA